jgi:hypothetical protein
LPNIHLIPARIIEFRTQDLFALGSPAQRNQRPSAPEVGSKRKASVETALYDCQGVLLQTPGSPRRPGMENTRRTS